jgi:hypothetical protein
MAQQAAIYLHSCASGYTVRHFSLEVSSLAISRFHDLVHTTLTILNGQQYNAVLLKNI